jgi:phosphoribosylaminoimidazolecarboxamide formyltransferase/IMP cyclohydrolase
MMPTALLSVHDKTGLEALGAALHELGWTLVASGGTAATLRAAALPVREVAELTGAAEMLGGRVKTLHPAIAGGILARREPGQLAELAAAGFGTIELVVCNLYPFAATVAARPDDEAGAIEEIDIGGVTLLRAAAKNHRDVVVCCEPAGYPALIEALQAGGPTLAARRALALAAFRHTAAYDVAIAGWLAGRVEAPDTLPGAVLLAAAAPEPLRYGENPHQRAALYRIAGAPPAWRQLGGKALSFNNLVDLEAAWAMPAGFSEPACAIVKHTNPCGLAIGATAREAFEKARAADPTSAFGAIIALNRPITLALCEAIGGLFVEALAAPAFAADALAWLAERKPAARLMQADRAPAPALELRLLRDGLLVQTPDPLRDDPAGWHQLSARAPTAAELTDLAFAWQAAGHVKSNAIVLARGGSAVGIGAGQMSRVDAVALAVRRAGERARGAVLASDAFFPFADGVEAAAVAGVTAVVQPGGSRRDAEVIAAADRLGLAMLTTGVRHFRH